MCVLVGKDKYRIRCFMGHNTIHFDIENFRLPNSYIESCPKPPKKPKRRRIGDAIPRISEAVASGCT